MEQITLEMFEEQEKQKEKKYNKDLFTFYWDKITSISTETKKALLQWMEDNGYFTDPASVRFHSNFDGGLCEHSIRVAEYLVKLTKDNDLKWSHEDSPLIIGLLHDLCKCGTYKRIMRNVKDDKGKWTSVPWFQPDDHNALLGIHGDRSVAYLLMLRKSNDDFSVDELSAIRWHMGPGQDGDTSYCYQAWREMPNLIFVSTADMLATCDEKSINY